MSKDMNSLNNENGGFVTTTSASLRSATHSSLRKSPFESSNVLLFLPVQSIVSNSPTPSLLYLVVINKVKFNSLKCSVKYFVNALSIGSSQLQ